jgi:hypothetical protein
MITSIMTSFISGKNGIGVRQRRGNTVTAVMVALCLAGCSTTYEPKLDLTPPEVRRSIDATVELHPLVAAEDLKSGHSTYGVIADDYKNRPPSALTKRITDQVLRELSTQGVFRHIDSYVPNPDYVLTGRIDQFYEHDRRKLWAYLPYYSDKLAGLFRVNSYVSSGAVKLTMMMVTPSGKVVGTYSGVAKIDEDYTPNDEMKPGDRLNHAFAKAVAQIRDKMLDDPDLPKSRLPSTARTAPESSR